MKDIYILDNDPLAGNQIRDMLSERLKSQCYFFLDPLTLIKNTESIKPAILVIRGDSRSDIIITKIREINSDALIILLIKDIDFAFISAALKAGANNVIQEIDGLPSMIRNHLNIRASNRLIHAQ